MAITSNDDFQIYCIRLDVKSFSIGRIARLLDVVEAKSSIGCFRRSVSALQSISVDPDIKRF